MSNEYQPGSLALTVLYDGDCGFCGRAATVLQKLDRGGRLHLLPLQEARKAVPGAPREERLMEQMHARDGSGHWFVGSHAWLRIADELPLLRPLGWIARLPVIRDGVEPVYAFVAAHRAQLSRLLGDDACRRERARRARDTRSDRP